MNRLLLMFLLSACSTSAFAAAYKCVSQGGKIEYQSLPCEKGRETAITQTEVSSSVAKVGVVASGNQRKCVGKELQIHFSDMPVRMTLQVLADFSGNKLVADPTINGGGAFNYDCTPWDTVLRDIASRYDLVVRVENGTIFAKKK